MEEFLKRKIYSFILLLLSFKQLIAKERMASNSKEYEMKSQISILSEQCKEEREDKARELCLVLFLSCWNEFSKPLHKEQLKHLSTHLAILNYIISS